ncbi:hypothetical protein [Microbulbifer sp. M83]|uniref:hypothetical protein n=1 Tax=Microbulbifer sp. M83 TaxID=3118246 RepID=UPI002FE290FB
MTMIRKMGFSLALIASTAVFAGEKNDEKSFPDSLFEPMEPFTGEEVIGDWFYDASVADVFEITGKVDEEKVIIRSGDATPGDVGLMKKKIEAAPYHDKRIMLVVDYKPTGVEESVAIYFGAVDQQDDQAKYLTWDSTFYSPIRGSSDWKAKKMVLQIPNEADYIAYGVGIAGKGMVEVGEVRIEEVDASVAVTDTEDMIRLFRERKFEEFLAEQGKIDFGGKESPRFVSLSLTRYKALKELDRDEEAGELLAQLVSLVESGSWQDANSSLWAELLTADVQYLADRITKKSYLEKMRSTEFPKEDGHKENMKSTYTNIGFKERVNGNYVAARDAYEKAASREWGTDRDYQLVDRYVKEMKQAVLAMDD